MSAHHILGLEVGPRLGCSPIKVVRELGSERRESLVPIHRGARDLKGLRPSTRVRWEWTNRWCTNVPPGYSWVATFGKDKR